MPSPSKSSLLQPSRNKTSYDEVPYKSYPYRQTHPERLATIAALFGLDAQPIDKCRVLEIGCAAGGNLLPMADRLPESEFVGVDLSSRQINEGQATIAELGMKNVRLLHADVRQLDAELGKFDYILTHGVYSWIPDDAQSALLDACSRLLAPRGVAYVSYNTFPGWHMRGMIREIMAYRARRFTAPEVRVRQARGLLHFLAESVPTADNAYGMMLNKEAEMLQGKEDYYLLHEHLEEHNDPIYFHEFAERARGKGLQYLAEADFSVMAVENFPPKIEAMLQSVAEDLIETEQYMDFVRNRMFRQTLLCHDDVALDRTLSPDRVQRMHVSSPTRPKQDITSVSDNQSVTFHAGNSVTTTTDPVVKAALLHLGRKWPEYVPFSELLAVARSTASSGPTMVDVARTSHEAGRLAKTLLRCYSTGHVELSTSPPIFCTAVSQHPTASSLARFQAHKGGEVTNRRHETVRLDDIDQQIVAMMDGSHDASAFVEHLVELAMNRKIIVHQAGEAVHDPEAIRKIATDLIGARLLHLARHSLLIQ